MGIRGGSEDVLSQQLDDQGLAQSDGGNCGKGRRETERNGGTNIERV